MWRRSARGSRVSRTSLPRLGQIPLGGTATGTGLNTHAEFAARVRELLHADTGLPISPPADPFESQAARDGLVELSGALKVVAVSLTKIASDLRLMGSGPRAGLSELRLPELQKGSSIMPGKVDPVIPEVVTQVAAQVIGNDTAITIGGMNGQFELTSTSAPRRNLLQSIGLLASASRLFAEKCIAGLEPNRERNEAYAEGTLSAATALNPFIGYDKASEIVKEAIASGRSLREVAREAGVEEHVLDEALDYHKMARRTTRPDGPYPFLGYPVGVCNEEPSCGYGFLSAYDGQRRLVHDSERGESWLSRSVRPSCSQHALRLHWWEPPSRVVAPLRRLHAGRRHFRVEALQVGRISASASSLPLRRRTPRRTATRAEPHRTGLCTWQVPAEDAAGSDGRVERVVVARLRAGDTFPGHQLPPASSGRRREPVLGRAARPVALRRERVRPGSVNDAIEVFDATARLHGRPFPNEFYKYSSAFNRLQAWSVRRRPTRSATRPRQTAVVRPRADAREQPGRDSRRVSLDLAVSNSSSRLARGRSTRST